MATRTLPLVTPSLPPAPSTKAGPEIRQEKLGSSLRDYIRALTERDPFTKDLVVDQNRVVPALAAFWPQLPEWNAQAYETWERIEDVVQRIKLPVKENLYLRVSVSPNALSPNMLEEPSETAAVAMFDVTNGIERQYILAPHEAPPKPEDMKIGAGLMIICQAQLIKDAPPLWWGANENEFGETPYSEFRNRDKSLRGEDLTPEDWKKNLIGLPFYLAPEYVMQTGSIFGQGNLHSGMIPGTVTAAMLQNILSQKSRIQADRVKAEEAQRNTNISPVVAAGAIGAAAAGAAFVERRQQQQPHERRTYPHERRGPGREEYFGDDNGATLGLTPTERRQLAQLNLIEGAAREELTTKAANVLIAANLADPANPIRPMDTAAIAELLAQLPYRERNNSPFAPPAEAVAAAAIAQQQITQPLQQSPVSQNQAPAQTQTQTNVTGTIAIPVAVAALATVAAGSAGALAAPNTQTAGFTGAAAPASATVAGFTGVAAPPNAAIAAITGATGPPPPPYTQVGIYTGTGAPPNPEVAGFTGVAPAAVTPAVDTSAVTTSTANTSSAAQTAPLTAQQALETSTAPTTQEQIIQQQEIQRVMAQENPAGPARAESVIVPTRYEALEPIEPRGTNSIIGAPAQEPRAPEILTEQRDVGSVPGFIGGARLEGQQLAEEQRGGLTEQQDRGQQLTEDMQNRFEESRQNLNQAQNEARQNIADIQKSAEEGQRDFVQHVLTEGRNENRESETQAATLQSLNQGSVPVLPMGEPDRIDRPTGFYDRLANIHPAVETGLQWGRDVSYAVQNFSQSSIAGIAGALGLSSPRQPSPEENRTVSEPGNAEKTPETNSTQVADSAQQKPHHPDPEQHSHNDPENEPSPSE